MQLLGTYRKFYVLALLLILSHKHTKICVGKKWGLTVILWGEPPVL